VQREKVWTLDDVKTGWLRVQSEVAYVRTLVAAHRLMKFLRQQEDRKFNPYHDQTGRFTTADGAAGSGAGSDTREGGDRTSTTTPPASDVSTVVAANEGPKILGRGARDFGQRVNTPSARDVHVKMDHILDMHTAGGVGFRTSTRGGGNKTMFPERMTPQDIDRAVREAYSKSREVSSPQFSPDGKIRLLEGQSGDLTIRMYYNSNKKRIDSAFPRR
jgi:Bacterial EndoU nuclease